MPPRRFDSGAINVLRQALRDLPAAAAHNSAAEAPELTELYAPEGQEAALDPNRALVIGNRGVGKTFWAAVLADKDARGSAATMYPRLRLQDTEIALGFHEAAGKVAGPAPSAEVLRTLLVSHTPEQIWRGVLLQALGERSGLTLPARLREILPWVDQHLEDVEDGLRRADTRLQAEKRRFVIIFDALDRLGPDWETIRRLTEGVLRFALDLRGYRAIRAKLFMRTDQAADVRLFQFPDASKLRAESVELKWRRRDLYGLLYRRLWFHSVSDVAEAFRACAQQAGIESTELGSLLNRLPAPLKNDEIIQSAVFSALAGPYMGADHRRGKTYTWLHSHLADAFGETSPRSFLIALQRAAHSARADLTTVLDHHAIRDGVQAASTGRLDQLTEDYPWLREVFSALEQLEVPCIPKKFTDTWRRENTVQRIRDFEKRTAKLGPLELADDPQKPEEALLVALRNIGVLELRGDERINVPDIFRVAGKMVRRGGVLPVGRR